MTTNDDLRDDVKAIEDSIGGTDGINVRLAKLELQIKAHQASSSSRDSKTQAMIADLAKQIEQIKVQTSRSWRISLDPMTARTVGIAIGIGLASALGLGGVASGVINAAETAPPASAVTAPAVEPVTAPAVEPVTAPAVEP